LDANTYIYQITARLEHTLLSDLTAAINDIYTYAYSPDIYAQNSRDNRLSVELTKRF
jgi:hypothetical protein